ncbi:MAG: hypothetical protein RRZ84_04985 [Romboutsia sp.]
MKITIYNSAKQELNNLMENNKDKYIRIFIQCVTMHNDAKIDLKVDDINEGDILFEVDGYKIIINESLTYQVSNISISFGGLLSRDSFSVDANFGEYDM